jgi:hypothetical protein
MATGFYSMGDQTADGVEIIQGDCLDVMKGLPDGSVDAVVTDPPYGIGLLGLAWDRDCLSFSADFWRQMLGVMKPGAHLVAFGASRTSHRLACAIEDAGFEIRDSIDWIYGTGYPKSLNVALAIDKQRDDGEAVDRVRQWLDEKRLAAGLSLAAINRHMGFADSGGGPASKWTTNATSRGIPDPDQWETLKRLLQFDDSMDGEVRRLNDRKGQPGETWHDRPKVRHKPRASSCGTMVSSSDSRPWIDASRERGYHETAGKISVSEAARRWDGWGTALKPAKEPIVLARKPPI